MWLGEILMSQGCLNINSSSKQVGTTVAMATAQAVYMRSECVEIN